MNNMEYQNTAALKSLLISFDHPIYTRQIRRWRGAFIEMAGWEDNLFHNHRSKEKYHYRYPQIQYRARKGKAAIFAIGDGVGALQKVLATSDWQIHWDGKAHALQIEDLRMNEHYLRMLAQPRTFKLYRWLALNSDNYTRWTACQNMVERIQLLEKLLTNHLLATLWGLGFDPAERVVVSIQEIRRTVPIRYHEAQLLAFDVVFSCNVLLPAGLGIGKGVSLGFGWNIPVGKKYQPRRKTSRIEQIHQNKSSILE